MATPSPLSIEIIADPRRAFLDHDEIKLRAAVREEPAFIAGTEYTLVWTLEDVPEAFETDRNTALERQTSDRQAALRTDNLISGEYTVRVVAEDRGKNELGRGETKITFVRDSKTAYLTERAVQDGFPVETRQPTPTDDQGLWVKLRQCLDSRTFERYEDYIKRVLCDQKLGRDEETCGRLNVQPGDCCYKHGIHGYQLLKAATEVYLLCHACCGETGNLHVFDPEAEKLRLGYSTDLDAMNARLSNYLQSSVSPGTLPYLRKVIEGLNLKDFTGKEFPFCADSVRDQPCLFELIWSYWLEEGMLVQTLNAISLRFQNRRVAADGRNPLANLELDPLRPLNNLLWGYIQDEDRRLTVRRRAYEYEHHYGLRLMGKAVGELAVAERRSKFLEAFHNLLQRISAFYKDEENLMIRPDPFPLLEAIRAVHLLLAEGAHNQFGDLPSTARGEMLIQQWLLAQPPMQAFLQGRAMVPYDERWMGQVDTMKKLMGWSDVSVIQFHKLAVYGEKILLSLRFGNWNVASTTADQAKNWAAYWKPEIQGYIEAYRTVTGVDLSAGVRTIQRVDATLPGVLLQDRLRMQRPATK